MSRAVVALVIAALGFAAGFTVEWGRTRTAPSFGPDRGIVARHRGDYPVLVHGPWRG